VFALAQHHNYSIGEIEDLIPYERDIYVEMLIAYLNEKKEQQKQAQG
jgi:hypothetical protein